MSGYSLLVRYCTFACKRSLRFFAKCTSPFPVGNGPRTENGDVRSSIARRPLSSRRGFDQTPNSSRRATYNLPT
jgi:hypothetical protein